MLGQVDELYASKVASAFVDDPDKNIRERARVILGGLSNNEVEEVAQIAKKGANINMTF